MNRLTKKFGNKVLLPNLPMEIKSAKDLDNYHEVRRDVENKIIKLSEYEDKEEQGLIINLPFKIGEKVFIIVDERLNEYENEFSKKGFIEEGYINQIYIGNYMDDKGLISNKAEVIFKRKEFAFSSIDIFFSDLNTIVFLDKELAIKNLKDIINKGVK